MTDLMERPRVTFDLPESVRRALLIYAAERSLTVGQVIEQMATLCIPEHVAQAERAIESGEKMTARKGRPPRTKS